MVRGRKPKPTALKILAGNPGHRPLNTAEPKPPADAPQRPLHLDEEAVREWDRVLPILTTMRVATSADRAVLAMYCQAWSRLVEAERVIEQSGEVLKGKDGGLYQNPYLAVANKAMEQIQKLAAELGLTPSSRSRMTIDKSSTTPTASGIKPRLRA